MVPVPVPVSDKTWSRSLVPDPVPSFFWSQPWSRSRSRHISGPGLGPGPGPGQNFWSRHTVSITLKIHFHNPEDPQEVLLGQPNYFFNANFEDILHTNIGAGGWLERNYTRPLVGKKTTQGHWLERNYTRPLVGKKLHEATGGKKTTQSNCFERN